MLKWQDVLKLAKDGNFEPETRVEKTPEEWKKILSPQQFHIARDKGTEARNTTGACELHKPGKYSCVCCGNELFDSTIKYESNSGWPSFTQPIRENSIKYESDSSYGMVRVETMCNNCDAHLGHVFPDGPEPSGLRYCINSISLSHEE